MEKLKEYLEEFGYLNDEIELIVSSYPLCNMKPISLLQHCKDINSYLLMNGYTPNEVIKMTKTFQHYMD